MFAQIEYNSLLVDYRYVVSLLIVQESYMLYKFLPLQKSLSFGISSISAFGSKCSVFQKERGDASMNPTIYKNLP